MQIKSGVNHTSFLQDSLQLILDNTEYHILAETNHFVVVGQAVFLLDKKPYVIK